MSPEKVWGVLEFYDKELEKAGFPAKQMTEAEYAEKYPGAWVLHAHARWMTQHCLAVFKVEYEKAMAGVPQPDRYGIVPADDVVKAREPLEKAMRWMCYVQGVCNSFGVYSCNELRDHSREEPGVPVALRPENNVLTDKDVAKLVNFGPLYGQKQAVPQTTAIPATPPKPPGNYGASSDGDWDAE